MGSAANARQQVAIQNVLGLHARPAARFVQTASKFEDCDVEVCRADSPEEVINGKSIMGLMMLAAAQHTELIIAISGPEAERLLCELIDLIQSRFGEE